MAFWKGHGPRHWLVSAARAMGFVKDETDYLGRWGILQAQSSDYVMTSRQIILRIQAEVTKAICAASRVFDEVELLEDIKKYADAVGLSGRAVRQPLTALLKSSAGWSLSTDFPTWDMAEDFAEAVQAEEEQPQMVAGLLAQQAQALAQPQQESPFWVSVSGSGFRRLRRRNTCGIIQGKVKLSEDVWKVTGNSTDKLCKDCRAYLVKHDLLCRVGKEQTGPEEEGEESSSSEGSSSSSEATVEQADLVKIEAPL